MTTIENSAVSLMPVYTGPPELARYHAMLVSYLEWEVAVCEQVEPAEQSDLHLMFGIRDEADRRYRLINQAWYAATEEARALYVHLGLVRMVGAMQIIKPTELSSLPVATKPSPRGRSGARW